MALEEDEGIAFFSAKKKRTPELADDQAEYEGMIKDAQDAGLAAPLAKSTGFSSHASDGYARSTVQKHIARTDIVVLERWIPLDTTFETAKDVDRINGDAIEMLAPSEPEVEERPGLMPLTVGGSSSTVAGGKNRRRVDG